MTNSMYQTAAQLMWRVFHYNYWARWWVNTVTVTLIVFCLLKVELTMAKTQTPSYQVIEQYGNIEIREYAPMLIAEVEVGGSRQNASSKGFRLLADFIFGNNTVADQSSMKIDMTAPVQQQAVPNLKNAQQKNAKIAMTAPVQFQAKDAMWQVSFVMPAQFTLENLPKPNNDQVQIKQIPAQRFIAIRFSGMGSDSNVAKHQQALLTFIENKKINTVGVPKYAFYNSPWTPAFWRRNEVMWAIE